MFEKNQTLYRYEDRPLHNDFFDDFLLPDVKLDLLEFHVLKLTPKGAWIRRGLETRWIGTRSKKMFAHPTIEEALSSFIVRKKRQIGILKEKLNIAHIALQKAEESKGPIEEKGQNYER